MKQTVFIFAWDIALVLDKVQLAQDSAPCVEHECDKMSLRLNASKTKVMAYNIEEDIPISTLDQSVLAVVDDFKYIGSHLSLCKNDACVRKAQARRALYSMNHIEILYVQPAQTTFIGGKSGINHECYTYRPRSESCEDSMEISPYFPQK